jgi:hypothetical protein
MVNKKPNKDVFIVHGTDQGKTVKVTGRLSGQKSKTIEYSKFDVID